MREVALGVSERLGFVLVDEGIVMRAALEAGVSPDVVADAEKRRSFVERAIAVIALSNQSLALAKVGVGGFVSPDSLVGDASLAGNELGDLIRTAIEETAVRGRVVIVAHAASHAWPPSRTCCGCSSPHPRLFADQELLPRATSARRRPPARSTPRMQGGPTT